jgi:hypothetical protein
MTKRHNEELYVKFSSYDKISVEIQENVMTRMCFVREGAEFCQKQALQTHHQLRFQRTECENN